MINTLDYQKSLNRELDIVKNRVRNLIGDAHWGEDGRYKEEKLKSLLKTKLPNNLSVGTGFILHQITPTENVLSKQIDIIVYDNNYSKIFEEGDFVIVTPSSVKAIIEVKSNISSSRTDKNGLSKIVENFNFINRFPTLCRTDENRIFRGLISFDYRGKINSSVIDDSIRLSRGVINHISLGGNIFIRHWIDGIGLDPPVDANCNSNFYNLYELEDLSHSYFISNLIHMTTSVDLSDRYFMDFPIEGSKETKRIRTVCL
ncbi:DUF6602 domain-containing protein [Epilithonimonas lactis]|uniref:DUF6602 domain-containing protein n=1 Tax=Epilithonimonas lactis TaxID=421072 RepID=A0A085B9G7_9FLAO|nr:DUF6602 domain-containing protein [Epilithonimonas lactis]KFC19112.1 hypothetical protein IO89_16515 [Epilithonimonas lactis]SEQ92583.1 hypothetical protein SAMN04488097_3392 [Epilithonimonas lactis]